MSLAQSSDYDDIMSSKSCIYNSRMRYLRTEKPSHLEEFEDELTRARRLKNQPCSPEKLMAPTELQTRESSLRYIYLTENDPTSVIKVNPNLSKKEDPAAKEKRETILAGMHEKEQMMLARKYNKKKKTERKNLLKNTVLGGRASIILEEDSDTESEGEGEGVGEGEGEGGEVEVEGERKFRPSQYFKGMSRTKSMDEEEREGEEENDDCYSSSFTFMETWKNEKEVKLW